MKEKILAICMEANDRVDYSADNLIDGGMIDSVTMVGIVSGIMEEFGIELPYEELIPENFNSLDAMVKLVEKYL